MPERNATLGFFTTEEIVFPETPAPSYVFERDCISFPARLDGKGLECLITAEVLMVRYHAKDPSEQSLFEAFNRFEKEIHEAAREQIQNRWLDEGKVIITTRFTDLDIKFSDQLRQEALDRAFHAQRVFNRIIGPRAGNLAMLWSSDDKEQRSLSLTVIDNTSDLTIPCLIRKEEFSKGILEWRLAETFSPFS